MVGDKCGLVVLENLVNAGHNCCKLRHTSVVLLKMYPSIASVVDLPCAYVHIGLVLDSS